ncbi:MAG: hypothetical protein NT062_37625 [Proteobacteria bacterium]|nr:hypothetical protein [Pseudomonadota bacterium]
MILITSKVSRAAIAMIVGTLGVVACSAKDHDAPSKAGSSSVAGSGSGSAAVGMAIRRDTEADVKKDKEDAIKSETPGYVPAEFKAGAQRWKDTGVYVDGQPIGFLTFGELPIALQPTWINDKISADKRPHSNDPGWKWAHQRYYKFIDYLKVVGIDPKSIKEMHVYGPKFTQTVIVTGKDLQSPAAKDFMFRFGVNVAGKALPHLPFNFGNGKTPDKINSVMIYVKKAPPKLDVEAGVFMLDGKEQLGVPYYGEPIRGGVRIYMDDKLATIIKRQELDAKKATTSADGDLHWSYYDFLGSKGVDSTKVVEAWIVNGERRREKISAADLKTMSFSAGAQAKGGVLMGDKKIQANAITMFSRAIKPDELPKILDEEEY